MRQIENEMLRAVYNKSDWTKDNTTVFFISAKESGNPHGARSEIYLYGNHIADYWHDATLFEVNIRTLREYPTRTTCSRLRACGKDVSIKKGHPYINCKKV